MSEHEKDHKKKHSDNNPFIIVIIVLLIVIAILAFFVWKNIGNKNNSNWNNTYTWITNNSWTTVSTNDNSANISVTVIWDKRCPKCNAQWIVDNLKNAPFLKNSKFEAKDFADEWVAKFLKDNKIEKLPSIIFNTNNIWTDKDSTEFTKILKPITEWKFEIDPTITRADFDPYAEICNNKIDDNWDNLIDCLDPTCSKEFKCSPKVDKPVSELYIMSYCPYWLQAQKWYLEVMNKLWKVADIKIKFVQYVMHWQKEADENVKQYCIQNEQNDKYIPYLKCFLDKEWKGEECIKQNKLDEKKLNSCITKTKKDFKVDELMNDKSKQYPDFNLNKETALKAWVQWSPTFVVNWMKIEEIWRDAKSYADAICSTFKNKPKECLQDFQAVTFDPMFGFTTWQWANSANPQCGN